MLGRGVVREQGGGGEGNDSLSARFFPGGPQRRGGAGGRGTTFRGCFP